MKTFSKKHLIQSVSLMAAAAFFAGTAWAYCIPECDPLVHGRQMCQISDCLYQCQQYVDECNGSGGNGLNGNTGIGAGSSSSGGGSTFASDCKITIQPLDPKTYNLSGSQGNTLPTAVLGQVLTRPGTHTVYEAYAGCAASGMNIPCLDEPVLQGKPVLIAYVYPNYTGGWDPNVPIFTSPSAASTWLQSMNPEGYQTSDNHAGVPRGPNCSW